MYIGIYRYIYRYMYVYVNILYYVRSLSQCSQGCDCPSRSKPPKSWEVDGWGNQKQTLKYIEVAENGLLVEENQINQT